MAAMGLVGCPSGPYLVKPIDRCHSLLSSPRPVNFFPGPWGPGSFAPTELIRLRWILSSSAVTDSCFASTAGRVMGCRLDCVWDEGWTVPLNQPCPWVKKG